MFNYLKKKFGSDKDKEIPDNKKFYSPLRVGLHSTIDINMVDWLSVITELNNSYVFPTGRLSVVAVGTTDTEDESNELYTFYLIDEKMEEFSMQVMCCPSVRGEGMEVVESILFREVRNITPQTEDEWEVEMDDIGRRSFDLDDTKYDRVWSPDNRGRIDMLVFKETIVLNEKTQHYTNSYILYGRDVKVAWATGDDTPRELLLTGVEETGETAELITLIGLTIPQSAISVQ